jgi:hypothetical protein
MDFEPSPRELLQQAVNALILRPDALELFEAMDALLNLVPRVPVRLTGAPAVLNPLLDLKSTDPTAFSRVMDLAEAKRTALGKQPLRPPKATGYDKTEYMRAFMDQKRERQKRAAEIENLRRPEKDRLIGNARLEFMRVQSAKWKTQRDAALAKASQSSGGRLSAEVREAVLAAFWAGVDKQLDDDWDAAKFGKPAP